MPWTACCAPRALHEDVNPQMQQDGETGQARGPHTSASVTGFGPWDRHHPFLGKQERHRWGLWWGEATGKALELCKEVAP